jgi:hypothetical protein
MTTEVVNLRFHTSDVKICRTKDNKIPPAPENGCFGNPYFLRDVNDDAERADVILKYEVYFLQKIESDVEFRKAVLALRDKKLGCFCKQPHKKVACHGDVIVKWLENNFE